MIMIISMQDIIFTLRLNVRMLDSNVRANMIEASDFLKRYSLNMTSHTLMQHVNSLIVMIIIYKAHNSLSYAAYTIMIIYFKRLMKYFNVEETINQQK